MSAEEEDARAKLYLRLVLGLVVVVFWFTTKHFYSLPPCCSRPLSIQKSGVWLSAHWMDQLKVEGGLSHHNFTYHHELMTFCVTNLQCKRWTGLYWTAKTVGCQG